jgi:hypothetical protein
LGRCRCRGRDPGQHGQLNCEEDWEALRPQLLLRDWIEEVDHAHQKCPKTSLEHLPRFDSRCSAYFEAVGYRVALD